MFLFVSALLFVAYFGAAFLDSMDWVAGIGLILAIIVAAITCKTGGRSMIAGMVWTGVVVACVSIGSFVIVLALIGPIFAPPLVDRMRPFFHKRWPEFEDQEDQAESPGVTLRR